MEYVVWYFTKIIDMKFNIKLTILTLVLNVHVVGALKSQSFLEIGNEWVLKRTSFSGASIESMKIVSDTMINGMEYKKIVTTEEPRAFRRVEFLREENNKIYRLNRDFEGELLMIDFGEDESYELSYENGEEIIDTEVIIDSTGVITLPDGNELNVKFVRILNNQSFYDDELYLLSDRVGFMPEFLFPEIGTGFFDLSYSLKLRCHINQIDTIRFDDILDCFSIEVSTSDISEVVKEIKIAPNPSKSEVFIENGFKVLHAYDLMGEKELVTQEGQRINVEELSNGIYILAIEEELTGAKYFRKFIKN